MCMSVGSYLYIITRAQFISFVHANSLIIIIIFFF